jgi:hypothetical protein
MEAERGRQLLARMSEGRYFRQAAPCPDKHVIAYASRFRMPGKFICHCHGGAVHWKHTSMVVDHVLQVE